MSRRGLVDEAVSSILERIADGTFSVAEPLPPEADLALLLDVSRPTMREAVRTLSDRGILNVVHGRGTFVAERSEWRDLPTLIDLMARELPEEELGLQLTQVRRMIEVGACGLAATNRTEEDLAAMRVALERYDVASAADDVEGTVRFDIAFHDAILVASGNPFLATIMQPLAEALYTSRRITSSRREVRDRAQSHHRRILAQLERGDSVGAKEAMRAHMSQTRDDFETRKPR
ncbi:MAG: FadR/GntR family transcriptional regulator [Propionibacteriaceae bacterium]|nr:FadR/GntR family transcriptional regulator [Propionibacteriaceae bacterium]